MAKELGISKNHYSRIETGRSRPSLDLLDKIAKVTNTELSVLLMDKIPSAAYIASRRSPTNTSFMAQAEADALKSLEKAGVDGILGGEPDNNGNGILDGIKDDYAHFEIGDADGRMIEDKGELERKYFINETFETNTIPQHKFPEDKKGYFTKLEGSDEYYTVPEAEVDALKKPPKKSSAKKGCETKKKFDLEAAVKKNTEKLKKNKPKTK
jgi:transcriptional regulator with XRE-family HTH domain